jgi:hypothetical protein
MKKLLCVWGASNYGKTSSIMEFDSLLNQSFGKNILQIHSLGNSPDDIRRIYKIGKITIGIESQGDPNSRQKSSLTLFGKNNCDIIVCASRTKGETVANVCNFCKRNGYDLYWISTIHSSSISLFNHHGAQVSQRNGQIIFDVVSDFMRGRY